MEDKKSELLQYAREYATANKDLYELLSVSVDAAQPEVHRAWRKASLKHHPDKAKNFDPEIWQLFERARDVLSSPEARAAYDSARAAALQAQKARAALDAKRRAMIDDLEARERGVKRKADGTDGRQMMTAAEKRVLMEKGREHLEKRQRMKEEAEARERERERERQNERTMVGECNRGEDDGTTRKPERQQPTQPNPTVPESMPTNNETDEMETEAPPPTDEYDERIADIERKLRERKAEKAARKADKKRKGHHHKEDERSFADEGAEIKPTTTTKPFSPPKSIPVTRPPTQTSAPGDFSSTMAKLRAAQREKERRKAEAEAGA